jgi:site-specific DNA-methyltransferase (adenine-specific)
MNPYYADEFVTLYHGDCREITAWLDADVLITDPPYPNNAAWFTESISAAREVLPLRSNWRHATVFWSELEQPPMKMPLVAVHIWHRTNVNGRPYESAYAYASDAVKRRSQVIRHPAVFSGVGPGCREYLGHPTQKPLSLMRQLVDLTAAGSVADPFAGSGSTLAAAKYAGRSAIGVEREERYCEVAARRLCQDILDFGAVPCPS